MKFEVNICNSMRRLILLALLFSSCDNRAEKYYIVSEGLDGPRCRNFLFTDYTNFEIAQCVESGLHFITPKGQFIKYEKYFLDRVALIYIREESDFTILKNNVFMTKIFEHWDPNWKISSIQLNDSIMLFKSVNKELDYKDFKHKIK